MGSRSLRPAIHHGPDFTVAEVPPRSKGPKSHVVLPSPEVLYQELELPEQQAVKATRASIKERQRALGNRFHFFLSGIKKIPHTSNPSIEAII